MRKSLILNNIISELKMVDFIYFQSSYFYFIFCLFLFWDLRLGFSIILYITVTNLLHDMTLCHISVTVTKSHVTREDFRRIILYSMLYIY